MYTELWIYPALGALLFWGVTLFLPKLLLRSLPPVDLIIYGCVFFFISVLIMRPFMPDLVFDRTGISYALLAGVAGTGGQCLYYIALTRGPLNIVAVITSLYPVLVALLAYGVLGELFYLHHALGIGLGMVAIVALVYTRQIKEEKQIKKQAWTSSWVLPALAALVVWSGWALFPKFALNTLPKTSIIFYEAIGGIIFAIVLLFVRRFRLAFEKKPVMIAFGSSFLSVTAVLFYLSALSTGPVAAVVMMTALYPVVTVILARLFLKEKLTVTQTCGFALSLAAIVLLSV